MESRPVEFLQVLAGRRAALRSELEPFWAGRERLVLEIGCGHGHFLVAFAAAQPARLCLGIDLIPERVDCARRRARRQGVGNVHFVRAEAFDLLAALPPALGLEAIFLLFPDPWPKRRHHKHRLLRPDFLVELARPAAPGALLCFRTDWKPYFDEAAGIVAAHPDWRRVDAATRWPFERETLFQQRAAGSYHSLVAERRERPDASRAGREKVQPCA